MNFENRVDALVQVGHGFFVYLRLRGQGGGIGMAPTALTLTEAMPETAVEPE